jgi:type I restriction enzyme, S subunit
MNPGYKQTDVGVIPEDWEEKSVGSVCKLINGRGFKPHEWKKTGLPIIRIQNLNGSEDFNYFEGPYAKKLEVENGQLLFAWSGSRGTSFGPHIWNGPLGLLNYHTWKVQVDDFAISKDFFLHALKKLTSFIEERAHGASALVHTQKWEMESFTFPTPPTSAEQHAIAETLSDVDALLRALDRLIAKKRDLKQAAMHQLLTGQTRLPGFHGEWEETTLGQIGDCIIGLTYKPENIVENGLLVLRSSNVQNGRLAYDDNVYVNLEVAEHLYTRPGDILVCVRNGSRALIGKCALIDQQSAGVTFGAFMSVYRTKHWRFIVHAFQADEIQRQIRDNIGATINQITNKDMKAFRVLLPPEDEQVAIAHALTEMDAELAGLEQRREKTSALKQGMMQELLTGRTRLISPKESHA